MIKAKRIFLHAVITAGLAAVMAGCVVAPGPMDGAPMYAPYAPPPPQAEVIPAAPFAGAVWINGSWDWSDGRYAWRRGHYERPRAGERWEPRRWTRNKRGGWEAHGGRWTH